MSRPYKWQCTTCRQRFTSSRACNQHRQAKGHTADPFDMRGGKELPPLAETSEGGPMSVTNHPPGMTESDMRAAEGSRYEEEDRYCDTCEATTLHAIEDDGSRYWQTCSVCGESREVDPDDDEPGFEPDPFDELEY